MAYDMPADKINNHPDITNMIVDYKLRSEVERAFMHHMTYNVMLEKNKKFNNSLNPSEREALERKSDTVTIKRNAIASEIEQLIEGRRAYEELSDKDRL